jgi:hypothetical protein
MKESGLPRITIARLCGEEITAYDLHANGVGQVQGLRALMAALNNNDERRNDY